MQARPLGTWVSGSILLVDGRLRLRGPTVPIVSGPAFVGPFSQGIYDLRGATLEVELVTLPQAHVARSMGLFLSNTWLRWRNAAIEFGFGGGTAPGTFRGNL